MRGNTGFLPLLFMAGRTSYDLGRCGSSFAIESAELPLPFRFEYAAEKLYFARSRMSQLGRAKLLLSRLSNPARQEARSPIVIVAFQAATSITTFLRTMLAEE